MDQELTCAVCGHKESHLKTFCLHLRRHEPAPYFQVNCPICSKKFTTVRYWKVHVLAKKCGQSDLSASPVSEMTAPTSPVSHEGNCELPIDDEPTQFYDARKELMGLILRLRARNVTERSCRDVLEFVYGFSKEVLQECLSGLEVEGAAKGSEKGKLELRSLKELTDLLNNDHLEQTAARSFGIVDPITVTLGKDETGRERTMQYLPLTPQLRRLCEEAGDGQTATQRKDGILCSAQDGYAHKNNDERRLLLAIYYDSFQLGNPLGSKTKNQKVGVVYGSVQNNNMPKEIFLVAIFLDKMLETHPWVSLLDPVVSELKDLESNGFMTDINGGTWYSAHLAMLVGDNLGVHSLAGFSQCFSGGAMVCRHCHGTIEDIRSKTSLKDFSPRTKQDYDAKMALLMEESFDPGLKKAFGINSACPFSSLTNFHVMMSLPPDVMHDVLEGVIPSTIGLVCGDMISQGTISLEELNHAIHEFPYSRVDRNRPAPLRGEGKRVSVKQKASEAWCLLRLLPLILMSAGVLSAAQSRVKVYSLVVQLIKIVLLLASFSVSLQQTDMLQDMVEAFLSEVLICFPSFRLTPKFHYLLHYPEQTRRHGPLRCLWSMRYEAKHQTLKQSMTCSRNRKNICKSISTRYQVRNAAARLESDCRLSGRLVFRGKIPEEARALINGAELYKRASVHGEEYGSGEVVLLDDGVGVVICVCRFPTEADKHILVQYQVAIYDSSVGAFCIPSTDHYETVGVKKLIDRRPLGTYLVGDHQYAVPRMFVPGYGML